MTNVTYEEIREEHEKVASIIDADQYLAAVTEKVELFGGLCDSVTAAKLLNNDLGAVVEENNKQPFEPTKIGTIVMGSDVSIRAKIISIAPIREFDRKDKSIGKVSNVIVADETGSISLSLWDEATDKISNGILKENMVIEATGQARDGYQGLMLNVSKDDILRPSNESMEASLPLTKINNVKDGAFGLFLEAQILAIGNTKTFNRKDGAIGKLANITLGDDTGKIAATLWGDKADSIKDIKMGETLLIKNANAKVNNYSNKVELQIGDKTTFEKTNKSIAFKENFTSIAEIKAGNIYSIRGHIIDVGTIREFSRDNGSTNTVGNMIIKDSTGEIRITLWGEKSDLIKIANPGMTIEVIDSQAKVGYNQDIELNTLSTTMITLA
jgi:replication factor A1